MVDSFGRRNESSVLQKVDNLLTIAAKNFLTAQEL